MEDKMQICCFCGQVFYGYGNNPYPASENPEDRCCNDCNSKVVIPARINQMMKEKSEDERKTENIH